MHKLIAFLFFAFTPALMFALDGQILINQTTVMAAGGFPYLISQPGSYKLSGNLIVPSYKDRIHIQSSNVTLDLNGFSIFNPLPIESAVGILAAPGNSIRADRFLSQG